jgi:eukaryotic-like serine/threonine-protein kinase
MGEVYRAHDTKLGRDVAIKILPGTLAHDQERLARFEREARTLAALNHPNIAHIHGFEDSTGTPALVMELVEGPTLADRIAEGALPLDEVLRIAKQIAEALETAHEQGIIHRDLKPANIKVRADGTVKVLDFGLAKMLDSSAASTGPTSESPTITTPALAGMTRQGVILGTAAYMAPEQARGRAVDARADIWAFGCVLYEMLTGRRAFDGEDVSDALASIIKSDPDWRPLPMGLPDGIRRLLKRCLEKNPSERLHAIADVRIEIADALRAPEDSVSLPNATERARRSSPTIAVVAVSLAVGGIAVVLVMTFGLRGGSAPTLPVVVRTMLTVAPADQLRANGPVEYLTEGRPSRSAMTLSPDGRAIVFSGIGGDRQQLYLRPLDHLEASPIAGTDNAASPFFSPDGKWVGFWASGALKKVAIDGGAGATEICQTQPIFGASWGPSGIIVFGTVNGGLWLVPDVGGTPKRVTKPDASKGETNHRLPQFLPGGRAVVFTVLKGSAKWDETMVAVVTLASGERRDLLEGADARYVSSGHLILVRAGTLMAAPFDLARLQVTGGAVTVIPNVMQAAYMPNVGNDSGAGQFAVSDSGSMVYVPGGVLPDLERLLMWIDRGGTTQPVGAPARAYFGVRLSPDGRRVAAWTSGVDRNVWIYDTSRGTLSRLTTEGRNSYAIWTPDSRHVTFVNDGPGVQNIFWKAVDGSAPQERLTTSEFDQIPMSWSPDGQTLAFNQGSATTPSSIWVLPMSSDRRPRPLIQTAAGEREPDFSPDGKWIAYESTESGRREVYVQPYPGPGARQQVSIAGGSGPAWSHDGRELFYLAWPRIAGEAPRTLTMMAVPVSTRSGFTAGKPTQLWERPSPVTFLGYRPYDVTADGRRFLVVEPKERPPIKVTEMILIQNWTEELKRLVPTK